MVRRFVLKRAIGEKDTCNQILRSSIVAVMRRIEVVIQAIDRVALLSNWVVMRRMDLDWLPSNPRVCE